LNSIKKTLFIGKNLIHFLSLDSTNQSALELLSKNKPSDGTVISTYNQLKGRGQIGSKWESEANKNITVSLILYPTFLLAREQFVLNQAISLGVLDFITKYVNNNGKVKWPNDIYIKDNKIGGILIQNSLSNQKIQSTVVGIGLNINQTKFYSEAPNPTSLALESGSTFDLDTILNELCESIERRYLILRSGNYKKLQQDYLNNLYRFMEDALYRDTAGTIFTGRITGIAPNGKLEMNTNKGTSLFDIKEIEFVKK